MRKVMTFAALIAVLGLSPLQGQEQSISRQRATNWCWAACVQGLLRQAGVRQSQLQVAARLDGWPRNRPASVLELVPLLRSYGLSAQRAGRPGTPRELYSSLASGAKLIAFVRPGLGPIGHFIVIEGYDRKSGFLTVSDPATGRTRYETPAKLYLRWRWGDSVVVRSARFRKKSERLRPIKRGERPVGVCQHPRHPRGHREPCQHPAHPRGDLIPCRHPLHPRGDLVPCRHFGRPHWRGDLVPCRHRRHPAGDVIPCRHRLHPSGHRKPCRHPAHPGGCPGR